MNAVELYKELDTFYQIRGDNYGYKYLSSFVKMVLDDDVPVSEFESYFKKNKDNIADYNENTLVSYQGVLKQFIKYVCLTENISSARSMGGSKKTTKIYDTFQNFRDASGYSFD